MLLIRNELPCPSLRERAEIHVQRRFLTKVTGCAEIVAHT